MDFELLAQVANPAVRPGAVYLATFRIQDWVGFGETAAGMRPAVRYQAVREMSDLCVTGLARCSKRQAVIAVVAVFLGGVRKERHAPLALSARVGGIRFLSPPVTYLLAAKANDGVVSSRHQEAVMRPACLPLWSDATLQSTYRMLKIEFCNVGESDGYLLLQAQRTLSSNLQDTPHHVPHAGVTVDRGGGGRRSFVMSSLLRRSRFVDVHAVRVWDGCNDSC